MSGSHDGTVRLWSLSLQSVSTSLTPGHGSQGADAGQTHSVKDKGDRRQRSLADFIEVQSPILCVTQVVVQPAAGMTSTGNSACRLVVAAGASDGTVAVWSADVDMDSDTLNATNCRLLFCHQLRPSER